MKSLFTGIDFSRHTAVSSTQIIYSFMSLFHLFIYFILIANIYFFKSIAWNLLSRIPYSVSVIPFPDSGFRIPSFSAAACVCVFKMNNKAIIEFIIHCSHHLSSHCLKAYT